MKDKAKARGMVTVRVLDADGRVKRAAPSWVRWLLGLPGRMLEQRFHNIVTRTGDALIADALLPTPTKTKVGAGTAGYIQVGTGWTGTTPKNNTKCNTPTGNMIQMDSGFPKIKAAYGSTGDTTVVYQTTFAAGKLNANGINEAALLNGNNASAECLAYAQISPPVSVSSSDTLQITWEITILGQ
jgi:hypothetical protein